MRKETGYRILAEGIQVSNNTLETHLNNNDMIIGSSGSGKTGGYVIPNIQIITGSLVVSDTKSQLYKKFSKELEKKGYEVKVLDFVNPERSCGYNPLSHIRRYRDGSFREQDVLSLANNLIQDVAGNDEPIWHLSARSYVAFLISYCLENLSEEEQNLGTICELNHAFSSPNGKVAFSDWIRQNPRSFASKKFREIEANKIADKMWASILGFANVVLEPFEFREADYIFNGTNSIDLKDLGRKKTVLFLNVSDTDSTFDILINILYYQVLQNLCSLADDQPDGRLDVPVRIIMDDFAASAKIIDFDRIISVIRSRAISVSLVLQSLAQLNSMYGKSKDTIIDNCDHIIYLGSQNIETANFIATRAKKTPENILLMPYDYEYLLTKGEEAKMVKKVAPYSTIKK
ncbi:MAG: type IV secretory system conjugative DNA transfer family protein [Lachnospiraceae bacterium]|nr:type IV secretory system conjugative DNA transfer family protein [Lachnospiraceae bacterium]